jgi:hypothetical protein
MHQKISFFVLVTILVAMPIGLGIIVQPNLPFVSRAGLPATPPVENNSPVVITTELPRAKLGRNYKADIKGQDIDLGNNLNMLVRNLPTGITLKTCMEKTAPLRGGNAKIKEITCTIMGAPTVPGEFLVDVMLNDGKVTVTKDLPLSVTP